MTLFVDMDGVLADFDRGIYELCGKRPEALEKKEVWATIHKHYDEGKFFFKHLPLMADAMELWSNLELYHPVILTATGHSIPTSAEEKRWWAKQYFPKADILFVEDGADKHTVMGRDWPKNPNILIDDRSKAIDPWIDAGGVGILHVSAIQSLKELVEKIK